MVDVDSLRDTFRFSFLPEPAPSEAASPHFSCLLLPPPAVLSGCSVHPPAAADVCPVTTSGVFLPGVAPVVDRHVKLNYM